MCYIAQKPGLIIVSLIIWLICQGNISFVQIEEIILLTLNPTAGGVCIFFKDYLYNFTEVINDSTGVSQDYEIISTLTARPDHRHFVTICVYKPPKGKLGKCIEFLSTILSKAITSKKEIWILGDFNTDMLKRNDPNTVTLQNFMKKWGLLQCVNGITRPNSRGGSCIDLIMTNCPFVSESGVAGDMISDHLTVFCIRKKKREKKVIKSEVVRDVKNYNEKLLCQLLDSTDWSEFDAELNPVIQWNCMYNIIIQILSIMCRYKKVHTRISGNKWITKNIYRLICEREMAIKSYMTTRDPDLLNSIRILRNQVDKAKSEYIKHLLHASKSNSKKFWRNIKGLIETDSDTIENVTFKNPTTGNIIVNDQKCNFVNDFFAKIEERTCAKCDSKDYVAGPIVESEFHFMPPEIFDIMIFSDSIDVNSSSGIHGINMKICKMILRHIPYKFRLIVANSMFSGIFPAEWAISNVKLLHKNGDVSNPGNWRPISMTNIFSKVLEKLVHKQVLKYLMDHKLLSNFQYGFLPGRSTHEAVVRMVKDIYSSINQKKLMGIMSLDIAKAFNCISHNILYSKMKESGFSDMVINWFRSYLNRSQKVTIGSEVSDTMNVVNGIAQGTVLGPILFIFYINDIFKCIRNVKMSLFADDCILYLSGNNWINIHVKMQEDFNAIIEWTLRNNLHLNPGKTNAMIVGTNSKIAALNNPEQMKHMNCNIRFVRECVYLGIVINSTMLLVPLVKNVKKRVNSKMFLLRKLRKFITFDASIAIYEQMILPLIDYAGFLLIGCRICDKGELQKKQNDILRICDNSRISDRVSIEKLHVKCKILSLEQRMRKQLLWLMYLLSKDNKLIKTPVRETRNAVKIVFKVPSRISPKYDKSPFHIGTKLWDELSSDIQSVPTVYEFKNR